jgi:hypothetical protein
MANKNEKGKAERKKEGRQSMDTPRQVLATLSNPVYMGTITDDGLLRDGIHIPDVSEGMFARVRAQLVSRRTRSPGRRDRIDLWLLKRFIRCSQCRRIMSTSRTRHGNGILPLLSLSLLRMGDGDESRFEFDVALSVRLVSIQK